MGYEVNVEEPYCITLVKGKSIIDLYVHPTIGGAAYLNGQVLMQHSEEKEFNGLCLTTLREYAEAIMSASHAIYKEGIYTLNDLLTIEKWASKKSFELAKELKCKQALKFAIRLSERIRLGLLETPYKIPLPIGSVMLLQKFLQR